MENVRATSNLISSAKVAGASVYDPSGESIGAIKDIMLDKTSGRVAYAVMSYGGFLGFGKSSHPLPWALLKYDRVRGGYVVDLSKMDGGDAPGYPDIESAGSDDQDFESRLHSYYDNGPL